MNRYPELIEKLQLGRDRFAASLDGIDNETAARKPAAGSWSILQCAEHVAIVEANLMRRLEHESLSLPEGPQRNIESVILQRGVDRSRRVEAPEHARPTGRFATLQHALAAFHAARAHTIEWVAASEFDLRRRMAQHPAFGTVTGYEMVLFMAMHPMRHALQIRELRG
jgi:uncharacterized damage-inducible protein DinB